MNSTLSEYLANNGFAELSEGHCQENESQTSFLKKMVSSEKIVDVMEIGFNAGHSAEIFLNVNPNIKLTSFDIGAYKYLQYGKSYIDMKYPFRHQLILGDSTKTVQEYIEIYPNKKFDLIFIDGGHAYENALKDISNCKNLAHRNTIVIVDDIVYNPEWVKPWNIGPSHAWADCTQNGLLTDIGYEEYETGRGVAWGKYNNITCSKKTNKTVKRYSKQ